MKNIFKKNHIIITALAIMIIIAGYLSFTNKDTPDTEDFTAVDGMDVVTNTDETADDIGTGADTTTGTEGTGEDTTGIAETGTGEDTTTDDTNVETTAEEDDTAAPAETEDNTDELGQKDISDDDILASAHDVTDNGDLDLEEGVPGEAVLASAGIDSGYFISSKLDREQTRAKNKADLREIINNPDISEKAKDEATNRMIRITEIAEKETATEILLKAKGFEDAVVFIVGDKVNVVVNAATLSDQQLAIIEEVVKDNTDIAVKNISINPAVIAE